MNIMDHSLLLGIHNSTIALDNVSPIDDSLISSPLIRVSNNKTSGNTNNTNSNSVNSLISAFQSHFGGLRGFESTTSGPKPKNVIYFFGIIDMLQEYNFAKMVEGVLKGIRYNKKVISAVASSTYCERFLSCLDQYIE